MIWTKAWGLLLLLLAAAALVRGSSCTRFILLSLVWE